MKRSKLFFYLFMLVLVAGAIFAKCGGSSNEPKKMAVDSMSPTGPAPDNNAANNPSLADTAYERDRTKPITDTAKKP